MTVIEKEIEAKQQKDADIKILWTFLDRVLQDKNKEEVLAEI